MNERAEHRLGLRDVIAGQTQICKLDEQKSQVYIYGYLLEELVEKHDFETTAYLTLYGELPQGKASFRGAGSGNPAQRLEHAAA